MNIIEVSNTNGNILKRQVSEIRAGAVPRLKMVISYSEWLEDAGGNIIVPQTLKQYRLLDDGNLAQGWFNSVGDPEGGLIPNGSYGVVPEIEAVLAQPDPQAYIDAVEASLNGV